LCLLWINTLAVCLGCVLVGFEWWYLVTVETFPLVVVLVVSKLLDYPVLVGTLIRLDSNLGKKSNRQNKKEESC
jgi:hypothetical protein